MRLMIDSRTLCGQNPSLIHITFDEQINKNKILLKSIKTNLQNVTRESLYLEDFEIILNYDDYEKRITLPNDVYYFKNLRKIFAEQYNLHIHLNENNRISIYTHATHEVRMSPCTKETANILGLEHKEYKLPLTGVFESVFKHKIEPLHIHCDIIDKTKNIYNGKYSDILGVYGKNTYLPNYPIDIVPGFNEMHLYSYS